MPTGAPPASQSGQTSPHFLTEARRRVDAASLGPGIFGATPRDCLCESSAQNRAREQADAFRAVTVALPLSKFHPDDAAYSTVARVELSVLASSKPSPLSF